MVADVPIDLISDTSTRPSEGMRAAMARADVGDEQRGEDPTVNRLCERVAELLGYEAAVFLPSGIMSNLIAILVHCRPGDEIIAARNTHIITSEGAGAAAIAGAMITTIETADGRFTADELKPLLRPARPRAPRTRLVSLEQTSNKGGGAVWSSKAISDIVAAASTVGAAVHLDGARILNAAVASGEPPAAFSGPCDSAWLDLSKGLGCPIGSVLAGSRDFIEEAWTWKHRLGGAMRQSGVLAAAGLYALEHNVEGLADDHDNARHLAAGLAACEGVRLINDPIETNIVYFDVAGTGLSAPAFAARVLEHGVRFGAQTESLLRAVTHLDVDRAGIDKALDAVRTVLTTHATKR